jgi:hypothetical protein
MNNCRRTVVIADEGDVRVAGCLDSHAAFAGDHAQPSRTFRHDLVEVDRLGTQSSPTRFRA